MSALTDSVESIIKHSIYDVALNAAKAAAYIEAPWLKLPVISQVFDFLLTKFADLIYVALDQAVIFSIIDIETQAQQRAYEEAVTELKNVVAKPEGAPSAEEIAKAREEFKRRLSDLIHINP